MFPVLVLAAAAEPWLSLVCFAVYFGLSDLAPLAFLASLVESGCC